MPFRRILLPVVGCILLAGAAAQAADKTPEAIPDHWLTDFRQARELARKLDRPLVLHFHATWCGPCQAMERDVLHTPTVKRALSDDVVGVRIDSDDNPDLISRFGIGSLPSDVVIDTDGTVLHRSAGYQGRSAYVGMIDRIMARYEPKQPAVVVKDGDKTGDMPAMEEAGETISILGLEGYSPVVLMDRREWIKGSPDFAAEYKGITYHFQSSEELELFRNDPSHYAPRLLGCDPVELWESDRALRGSTRYGAYFDGQLFLFLNADNREQFKTNPLRYSETRHVLRSADIVRQ